ncbi:MAG TPA: M56 family metallopeptidase [Thermoanaerobaculia bacterium]
MLDLWLAALLDASLKGLLLCLAAGAAVLMLRQASAAARHLVWRLAIAGLLALPALAAVLPAWRVSLPLLVERSQPAASPAPAPREPSPLPVSTASFNVPSPALPSPAVEETAGWTISWKQAAFGIWLAGALSMLGSLGVALARVRWQRRHARPIADEAWTGLLDCVCAELGIRRPVELFAGGEKAMPMTWGWRRPAVLLPASAEAWPEPRRRTVLLHELAHVARGDYLTQLAAEVARALHWLNPLAWIAARKLRLESEHACDDRVITAGTRASDYAGELVDIARSLRAVRAVAPAGLAMARPSELTGRLLAVLDAERNRRSVPGLLAFPAWLAAACLVVPLAVLTPVVDAAPPGAKPAPKSKSKQQSVSINVGSDDGTQTFQISEDDHKLRIRTEGKVTLTEDWTGIASLSPGAEMRIEEENGVERRLDVEPGSDGRPVYKWKVNGRERAFDAEGRKWLQAMLLEFVRGTGYAADQRVAYFLKRQGPEGVFAEISQLPSDYVKRIYFGELLERRDLPPGTVERAIRQAGREVESDYELRQVLTAVAEHQAMTEPLTLAFAEAAASLDSDYEQRTTLVALIEKGRLSSQNLAAVLRATRGIESDYELRQVLAAVAGKTALGDAAIQRAYVEAVNTIASGYERRQTLSPLIQRTDLSQEALVAVLRVIRGVESDYERATVLVELAEKHTLTGAARDAYLDVAKSINSRHERDKAEAALGRQRPGR